MLARLVGVVLATVWAAEEEVTVAPISLIVPAYVTDIPRLPLFISSLGEQTIMPLETIVIVNIPLKENYLGPLMFPVAESFTFDNFTGVARAPTDEAEIKGFNKLYQTLGYKMADVFVKAPSVKIWTRTEEHCDEANRLFGISKADARATIYSFFTASDMMHPQRISHIWETFQKHDDAGAVVHNAGVLDLDIATVAEGWTNFTKSVPDKVTAATAINDDLSVVDTDLAFVTKTPVHASWLSVRASAIINSPVEAYHGMTDWIKRNSKKVNVYNLKEPLGALLTFHDTHWDGEKELHLHSATCDYKTGACH